MNLTRALATSVLCLLLPFACSSSDDNDDSTSSSAGKGGSGGKGNAGSGTTAGSSSAGEGNQSCSRFGYIASGNECPTTGCPALRCSCPDSFPISIASCSSDGCLVRADCDALCAEGLEGGFPCLDTYTVAPSSGGSAGTGGQVGAAGAPPIQECKPEHVKLPPDSASALGNAQVSATHMITDANGNMYIAGVVDAKSAVNFGGEELAAGKRLFLLKLNATGGHVWSRRFGTDYGLEKVTTLSFAPNGDLLMGGITKWVTDLGNGPEPATDVPQLFAVRYTKDGAFAQSYLLPTSNSIAELVSVVEMPSGEVHFWGNFGAPFTVGSTTLDPAGTTTEHDVFVVRFVDGKPTFAKQYGDTRNDLLFDVIRDKDGNVYLLGFSFYEVPFGPIDIGSNGLSYVAKLGPTHEVVWSKLVGSGGSYPRRAVLDDTTLIVAGDAYGGIYYEASTSGGLPKANLYVLRIDISNGALLQGKTYAALGNNSQLRALSLLPDGGVAIAGHLLPPADFGGGQLDAPNRSHPFAARYDAAGEHVWSTFFCTMDSATVAGIGYGSNSVVLSLGFRGALHLGSSELEGGGSALLDMPAQ